MLADFEFALEVRTVAGHVECGPVLANDDAVHVRAADLGFERALPILIRSIADRDAPV
jgi:hypothetical protein